LIPTFVKPTEFGFMSLYYNSYIARRTELVLPGFQYYKVIGA